MLIGLTGGIGSGKSAIARALMARGYAVYDTDSEAKRLICTDPELRAAMAQLLGSDIYEGDVYRTDIVAQRVFASPSLLSSLNQLVHPAVLRDVARWSEAHACCFVESALLYESGLDRLCDSVVHVTAPEQVRIERVLLRDHTDSNKVRARIRAQHLPASADYTIDNDGSRTPDALADELLAWLATAKA